MKFALFYEIPVPKPFTPGKEHAAYKNTLEQAILGDEVGFHAFWTVEHHFLEEYSHCSNPEVLYGAIAARTKNIRIGYGVRLLPSPYNHPIRSAESAAVLDLLSDGRVDFGTGRSSTAPGARGLRRRPRRDARDVEGGARPHRRRVDRGALPGEGQVLEDGRPAARAAEAAAGAAPADLRRDQLAPGSRGGRASGHRPLLVHGRHAARGARRRASTSTARASRSASSRSGKFKNETAATFTMVHCAPTKDEAYDVAASRSSGTRRRAHASSDPSPSGSRRRRRRSAPTSTRRARCSTTARARSTTSPSTTSTRPVPASSAIPPSASRR